MIDQEMKETICDIHCHILPGIDDGSRNWDMTLQMVQQSWDAGVRTMIATPHYLPWHERLKGETVLSLVEEARQKVASELGVEMTILAGEELYYHSGLMEELQQGKALTMAGSRYILLEFAEDDEDPLITAAEDRLLSQMLFSGEMAANQEELLLRQYGKGDTHRVLAAAGISQYCHYVFAEWHAMSPDIMRLITTADREGHALPAICRLAFLKTLADRTDNFTEDEAATAKRFMTSLLREEIVFPFYRQFAGAGPGLRLYDRETMIEYHNPAGVRGARGHVVIHCALERGGRQEPFMAREMKEMVRGFYVSSFFLFYGEQVHYFITDDPEEKNIVESGTIGQDARIDLAQTDRFAQIDAISRAAALREREKTVELLSEYTKKEYLTAVLFGAEEENDVIYQTT